MAGGDVVPDPFDGLEVLAMLETGHEPGRIPAEASGRRRTACQALFETLGGGGRLTAIVAGTDWYVEPGAVFAFVMNQNGRWRVKAQVGQPQVVHAGARQRFQVVFEIVSQIPEKACRYRFRMASGPGFISRQAASRQDFVQKGEGVAADGKLRSTDGHASVPAPGGKFEPGVRGQDVVAGTVQVAAAHQDDRSGIGREAGGGIDKGLLRIDRL